MKKYIIKLYLILLTLIILVNSTTIAQEPCIGVTLISEESKDGFWMLNNEMDKANFYEITPPKEEKTEFCDFLFPIVPQVKSVTLKCDGKVILDKIKIN